MYDKMLSTYFFLFIYRLLLFKYTKDELRGLLPQKNNKGTNSNVTINMNKPTIFSANDNSKVVINQANSVCSLTLTNIYICNIYCRGRETERREMKVC